MWQILPRLREMFHSQHVKIPPSVSQTLTFNCCINKGISIVSESFLWRRAHKKTMPKPFELSENVCRSSGIQDSEDLLVTCFQFVWWNAATLLHSEMGRKELGRQNRNDKNVKTWQIRASLNMLNCTSNKVINPILKWLHLNNSMCASVLKLCRTLTVGQNILSNS